MSIQKVKVNCKGITIAKIEFKADEYENYHRISSENVENQYIEWEQTSQGFIEVLEIDIRKSTSELILDDINAIKHEIGYMDGYIDADEYGRDKGIGDVLGSIFRISNKYDDFKYKYDQEEWDKMDNTNDDVNFTESDFYNINVTDENHPKAMDVTYDFATDLIEFLKNKLMEMI